MPAPMALCCCCDATVGLVSDICSISLMMFCLSMGLGNETGRSSQNSCGWAFCRSFRMSSSSDDWRRQREKKKKNKCKNKKIKHLNVNLENNGCFTCRYTNTHDRRCSQSKSNALRVIILEMGIA